MNTESTLTQADTKTLSQIGQLTGASPACRLEKCNSHGESLMRVTINGNEQTIDDGLTIAQLLEKLGKSPKFLAVERNFELVPRTKHAESPLADGDTIEIVTLVGGG